MPSVPSRWQVIETEDGTPSLRHLGLDEACHARQGARREAALKFAAPAVSSLKPGGGEALSLLDACFGLGYNTFEFLGHPAVSARPVRVLAVELDPQVWRSLSLVSAVYPGWQPILPRLMEGETVRLGQQEIAPHAVDLLDLLHPGSALFRACDAVGPFDFIFHDAFSVGKVPELWTADLARAYLARLRPGGSVLTYSSAHPVCAAFIEAGFSLSLTEAVDRKKGGLRATRPMPGEAPVVDAALLDAHRQSTARVPYRHLPPGPGSRDLIRVHWEAEKARVVASGGLTIKQYLRRKAATAGVASPS